MWAAIGAATIGVVGSAVLGGGNSSQPTSGSPAAQAADPFAAQRAQYQGPLAQLMGQQSGNLPAQGMMNFNAMGGQGNPNALGVSQQNMMAASGNTRGSQTALQQMQQMLAPGNNFQSQDPSYQFRLQQGTENLNRGAAKSGLLGSGNRMAELQAYGQGQASQEYNNQFSRLQSNLSANLGAEQQGFAQQQAATATNMGVNAQNFNQFQAIDQNTQNQQQNQYARLAQLSGATTGSQSSAGQILQAQAAGSAAQMQQWGGLAVQAGQQLWNNASSPGNMSSGQQANSNYVSGLSDQTAASDALAGGWM
jgi:hypothetical protein